MIIITDSLIADTNAVNAENLWSSDSKKSLSPNVFNRVFTGIKLISFLEYLLLIIFITNL